MLIKYTIVMLTVMQLSFLSCRSEVSSNGKVEASVDESKAGPLILNSDGSQSTMDSPKLPAGSSANIVRRQAALLTPKVEEKLMTRLVDHLPSGFVKNGTVDYTSYVQKAIDRFDSLVFPSFPLLINDKGLKLRSNQTLMFLPGSELRLKASVKRGYSIINIEEISNVEVNGIVIRGDRYTHKGNSGEWGMGISVIGSNNIRINKARISECWGDGIYIGQTKNTPVCRNISIKETALSKNRRDGISIISVDGLLLENIYAGYQDGTKPMCGINFEPNNPACEIKNVKVVNPKTDYNSGSGIQIQLSKLLGADVKQCDIKIVNHTDFNSTSFSSKVACNRKLDNLAGKVVGIIEFVGPVWNSTLSKRPLSFTTDQPGIRVLVKNVTVKDLSGNKLNFENVDQLLKKFSNGDLQHVSR
jgi:hypothetical protein